MTKHRDLTDNTWTLHHSSDSLNNLTTSIWTLYPSSDGLLPWPVVFEPHTPVLIVYNLEPLTPDPSSESVLS